MIEAHLDLRDAAVAARSTRRCPTPRFSARACALARAKAVGEEYEGVEVATAIVRARRTGQAIVGEARRRGVEAIVLAAEEPSRVRGGGLLGGVGATRELVGAMTRYVISKAPCRVILTAPPDGLASEVRARARGHRPTGGPMASRRGRRHRHRDPRLMARIESSGPAAQRRPRRPVRHRLRQRRLLDLLRAGTRRRLRARPHPDHLHARRRAVRADGQDLRRGRSDVP